MTIPDTKRGYIRPIPGLPIERQRQMARDAGCDAIYEWEGGVGRLDWIKGLRSGDTAWVPSLLVLTTPPGQRDGTKPSAELAAIISAALGRGAVIVEAVTGRTSRDKCEWAERVQQAVAHASQGERPLAVRKHQTRQATAARVAAGVTARWLALKGSAEYEQARAIWTSAAYETWEQARAALPDDELRRLSRPSLYAIFDARRPGDKRAGGRPRKDGK
ncbi:MAG: hypothetical protein NW217_12850 [Hyphomicrobiaceae bacterium]|nr:hypothetical protein [Hyphomicrobiaceae bacterium]